MAPTSRPRLRPRLRLRLRRIRAQARRPRRRGPQAPPLAPFGGQSSTGGEETFPWTRAQGRIVADSAAVEPAGVGPQPMEAATGERAGRAPKAQAGPPVRK